MEQEQHRNLGNDFQNARRILSLAKNAGSLATPSSLPIVIVAVIIVITFFLIMSTTGESGSEIAVTSPTPQPSGVSSASPSPTIGGPQTPTPIQSSTVAPDCPIPNGIITCGSKFNIKNGCGHCRPGYYPDFTYCTYKEIEYAIDIGSPDGSPVYLPMINGHIITWTFQKEQTNTISGEPIQRYVGVDQQTKEVFNISLHHTQNGSGNSGVHNSGERGANICSACNENHVHVEVQQVKNTGGINPLDATGYFCKN